MLRLGKARGSTAGFRTAGTQNNHEKLLLNILLKFPELSESVAEEGWAVYITDPEIKSILEEIINNGVRDVSSILLSFQGSSAQGLISEALMSSPGISDRDTAGKMIESCIGKLIQTKIKDELKILRIRMDEAIKNKDVLLQKRLLKEYDDLMKQKKPEEGRPYEK
jgi:hypothetical protein